MGYTHYWRKCLELDVETFKLFAEDCKAIADYALNSENIGLAGYDGEGSPEFNEEFVCFNGLTSKNEDYETFRFTKSETQNFGYSDEHGLILDLTKTAMRPYDSIVTACLICAKYHFKDQVYISSDGEPEDWIKGLFLASAIIGGDLEETFAHLFEKPSNEMRKAFLIKLNELKREDLNSKPIPGSISSKDTAKLIRQDLKKNFPECKFSVVSDYNTIRVKWENGPCTEKVQACVGHYKSGHYIKITDNFGYDDSPYNNQYLFFNREIDKSLYLNEAKRISKMYGVDIPHDLDYNTIGSYLWTISKDIKTNLEREIQLEISKMDY